MSQKPKRVVPVYYGGDSSDEEDIGRGLRENMEEDEEYIPEETSKKPKTSRKRSYKKRPKKELEEVLEWFFNKPKESRFSRVEYLGEITGLDFLAVCEWVVKRSELEEKTQHGDAPEEAPALPENAPEEAPDFQEDPRGMCEERELDPQDEFFEVGFHNQDDGLVDEMSQPHAAGLSNTDSTSTLPRQMSEEQEEEETDKEANDSATVSEEHELSAQEPDANAGEDEFLESLEAIKQLFESVDHVVRVTSLERSEVKKLLHQQSNTPDDEFGLLPYQEQIRKVLYFFKRDEEKIDLKVLEKWAECDLDLLENIFETVKQEWRTEARNNTTQGHPAVMPNPRNSLNPPYFRYHQDNDHFREPQRIMNEEGSRVEKEHSNVTNALNLQYPLNHQNLTSHEFSQNHQAQQWQPRENENLGNSSAIAPNSRSTMDLQNVPSHESNQHDQANSNQHCPQQSSSRRIKMEPADDRAVQNVGASKRKRKHIHHVTEEQMQSKRVKTERDEDNSSSSRNSVADLPSHHRSEENQTQLPQREIKPEPRDDNES